MKLSREEIKEKINSIPSEEFKSLFCGVLEESGIEYSESGECPAVKSLKLSDNLKDDIERKK